MSADDVSWYHKRPVVLYLILANGITWLCWIPGVVVGLQRGYVLPAMNTYATLFEIGFADSQHLVLSILFSLGVYGPLIGALVATWGMGVAEAWPSYGVGLRDGACLLAGT